MRGFYFITDPALSRAGIFCDVRSALKAGVKFIQYREKNKTTKEMLKEAMQLRKICRNAALIINDRVDIALSVGADGVHLGSDDLPYALARRLLGKRKIIGVTVHSLKEAIAAERQGADYLGVSPIFPTRTKIDAGKAKGAGLIKKISEHVSIPIIAIGGIDLSNAEKVIQAGAEGLCAISAVAGKSGVRKEIEKFQQLFRARCYNN